MGFWRRLLGGGEPPVDSRATESVRRIAPELQALPPRDAKLLAAFAYVLARVAFADRHVAGEEVDEMQRLVQEYGGLDGERATLVVRLATAQATERGGTENYLVTREFRDLSTREERVALVRCLFAVAAADMSISEVESQQIMQVASEIGLSRPEVVAIRQAFRDRLEVLRDLPRGSG
jgi:uncharacterized tellurite resistance protein B-like protein